MPRRRAPCRRADRARGHRPDPERARQRRAAARAARRSPWRGIAWEVIFVDDDSPDGTWAVLQRLPRPARTSAACGGSAGAAWPRPASRACSRPPRPMWRSWTPTCSTTRRSAAPCWRPSRPGELDVVVGTRFAGGGSVGEPAPAASLISRLGRLLSRAVSRAELSDPMSGFFVLRREFLERTVHRLSGHGFKILLDLFASAPRPVRFAEVPYRFRQRRHGHSKLDAPVMLDYVTLLGDKLLGRYRADPVRDLRPGRPVRDGRAPGGPRAVLPARRAPVLPVAGDRDARGDDQQFQSEQRLHLSRPAAARSRAGATAIFRSI